MWDQNMINDAVTDVSVEEIQTFYVGYEFPILTV